MYKISNSLNIRISGGSAYLTPSIFNYSDSKDLVKHNILFSKNVSMSKANSLNLDFGYKLIIDEFVLIYFSNQSYKTGITISEKNIDPTKPLITATANG